MKTLILGIGNLLMGDEGAGIHVVRHLEAHFELPDVNMVDGGTGGFHLMEYFQSYERVILIDATIDGHAPGTLAMLQPKFSKDYPPTLTAHDIGLKDLLDALYVLNSQPQIVLFTISIRDLNQVGLELTPEVAAAVPEAAQQIAAYLRQP